MTDMNLLRIHKVFITAFFALSTTLAIANTAAITPTPPPSSPETKEDKWQQARVDYQLAREVLEKNDFGAYLSLREELTNYPLYPYLEYEYLRKHLSKSNTTQIHQFLNTWSTTPLASTLKHQWLRRLAKSGQWQHYLDNYDAQVKSTELRCYAQWAQHKTGHTESALNNVTELWLVGRSQPDACNPIFELWIKSGRLTDVMAWKRFELAMSAGNPTLARYLIRFMSAKHQKLANLSREIYLHPHRLKTLSRFEPFNNDHRNIILQGFKRLARKDSLQAYQLWPEYQKSQDFHSQQISLINHQIMLWLAHQDNSLTYQEALQRFATQADDDIVEAGVRLAIRQQDWPLVISLTLKLSEDKQNSTRSQYWLVRAQLETDAISPQVRQESLRAMSQQRDYYSFMAADVLKQPYRMNSQRYSVDGNFLERFKQLPAIIRARELLHAKQLTAARREWYQATLAFDKEQHYTAALYAQQINWNSQAIRSTIAAKRWHDLELRFPLSFEETIEEASQQRQLNSNWLFAMARQESALSPEAVSHKGARGLIQIMPATARNVARKHKIAYHSHQQLFDPQKNAELASAYLSSLLEQFDGNHIYATAAYNAGPHRVEKWLKTTRHLPIDVWVESIPFHETRQYVKNVMAYSAIYAHRRNQSNFQMATTSYPPIHHP